MEYPEWVVEQFAAEAKFKTMSYSSVNEFPAGTRVADVREFLLLLGYKKLRGWAAFEDVSFESYSW